MGQLLYGNGLPIEVDDRALAHLEIVIESKLRAHEEFFFSWDDGRGISRHHSRIWMESSVSLDYYYTQQTGTQINPDWIDDLAHSVDNRRGLHYLAEPHLG